MGSRSPRVEALEPLERAELVSLQGRTLLVLEDQRVRNYRGRLLGRVEGGLLLDTRGRALAPRCVHIDGDHLRGMAGEVLARFRDGDATARHHLACAYAAWLMEA